MLARHCPLRRVKRYKRESPFPAIGQSGKWFNELIEEKWAQMSGPFIKYGDGLKTVPFIRNKIDIRWETDPKKKMQAEQLFERIIITDQEAVRMGALIVANFVAFYFWWTLIWWVHGLFYSIIYSFGAAESNEASETDYEAEIRSLEGELIKSRRDMGALNLELSKMTRDIVSLRKQNETLDELVRSQRAQIDKLKEQLILN